MYKSILKNIYKCAIENNKHYRSEGSAMEVVDMVLNNYEINIENEKFNTLPEDICLKVIFQIIVELRHVWFIALEFYQESAAKDIKNLLTKIENIDGVYELEGRTIVNEMKDSEYELYRRTYGLM